MDVNKLYVGNLPYSVTEEQLKEAFSKYGLVQSVTIIAGKGFGFVEMSSPAEAEAAKAALDGSDLGGRTLKVDEARPPKKREYRGGGGFGHGGGGGGFGRGGGGRRSRDSY